MDRTGYLSAPKFRHKAPVAYPALRLAAFSQHLHTVVSFILWNKIGSLACRGVSWRKRQGYVSAAAIVIFFIIFSGWSVFEKCFLTDDGNGF